jgi:pimeloyl-ACP methyl ester carboxylesterase
MPDIHVLPGLWTAHVGYGLLLSWLRATFGLIPVGQSGAAGNLLAVPYDWRLSNRFNGRRLGALVEPVLDRWRAQGGLYADAKVVFICHSMGGLVARWYIQREGGAEVTRKLITLGTPHRGALKSLEQLVNGVRKGPWPFRVDLTEFARSLPATHQLLPQYACLKHGDGLKRTTEVELPGLASSMVKDAMRFHDQLNDPANPSWGTGIDLHPIQGQKQLTVTTGQLVDGELVTLPTIETKDEGGDATVPALSAMPEAVPATSPTIRHVTERHGALQSNRSVFDEIEGVLTASTVTHRAPTETAIDVRVDEVLEAGERLTVEAVFRPGDDPRPLEAILVDANDREVDRQRLTRTGELVTAAFDVPAPGGYEAVVRGFGSARGSVSPVKAPMFAWGPS